MLFFFFKQKTAYEMRISDWSSDVCSSDLAGDTVATTGQHRVDRGDIPPELRQMLNAPAYALQEIRPTVVSTTPKGIVHIDGNTEVELRPDYTEAKEAGRADVTSEDRKNVVEGKSGS